MKKFIFYPGLDPVNQQLVKTFIRESNNIVFYLLNGNIQTWHFKNVYKRDQTFAYLIFNYTDRKKDLLINELGQIKEKTTIGALIYRSKIIFKVHGEQKQIYSNDINDHAYKFHLLILELFNDKRFMKNWLHIDSQPYPYNINPLNQII